MKFWSVSACCKNRKWFSYIWSRSVVELIFLIVLIWSNIMRSLVKIWILSNNRIDASEFSVRSLRNSVRLLNPEYEMRVVIKYSLMIMSQKSRHDRKSLMRFRCPFHILFLSQLSSIIHRVKKQLSYSSSRYIQKSIASTWISRWNKLIIILI